MSDLLSLFAACLAAFMLCRARISLSLKERVPLNEFPSYLQQVSLGSVNSEMSLGKSLSLEASLPAIFKKWSRFKVAP